MFSITTFLFLLSIEIKIPDKGIMKAAKEHNVHPITVGREKNDCAIKFALIM